MLLLIISISKWIITLIVLQCLSNDILSSIKGSKSLLWSLMYLTVSLLCRICDVWSPSIWSPKARNKQFLEKKDEQNVTHCLIWEWKKKQRKHLFKKLRAWEIFTSQSLWRGERELPSICSNLFGKMSYFYYKCSPVNKLLFLLLQLPLPMHIQ